MANKIKPMILPDPTAIKNPASQSMADIVAAYKKCWDLMTSGGISALM